MSNFLAVFELKDVFDVEHGVDDSLKSLIFQPPNASPPAIVQGLLDPLYPRIFLPYLINPGFQQSRAYHAQNSNHRPFRLVRALDADGTCASKNKRNAKIKYLVLSQNRQNDRTNIFYSFLVLRQYHRKRALIKPVY